MNETTTAPAMSVILATPGSYPDVARTIEHLRVQTVKDRLELVLVTTSEEQFGLDPSWMADFWGYQVVPLGSFQSVAQANTAGVRRARASLVVLAEDHCFPQRDWAEALLAAHQGPWAAVGPVFINANPRTACSWADFLIGYGPWMHPRPSGPAPFLPGHNSSYKRSVLLEYGDRLGEMMEAETVLHWDLGHRGKQLYIEAAAQVVHANISRLELFLPVKFLTGRQFAGYRALRWSWAKRLAFVAGSPLIPWVRLWRHSRELFRPGRPREVLWRVLPVLVAGLLLDGLGQMVGYLAGPGDGSHHSAEFEFQRLEHVNEEDRRALTSTG